MGDSCCHPRGIGSIKQQIEDAFPGIFVFSVATGQTENEDVLSTYFGNANDQVARACELLSSMPELRGWAFVGVGFRQGGLLLRALIQRCTGPDAPRAHTLVTMGSPHNGVSGVPGCWINGVGRAPLQYGWCEVGRLVLCV